MRFLSSWRSRSRQYGAPKRHEHEEWVIAERRFVGPEPKNRIIKSTVDIRCRRSLSPPALSVGINYWPCDFGAPLGSVARVAVVSLVVLT